MTNKRKVLLGLLALITLIFLACLPYARSIALRSYNGECLTLGKKLGDNEKIRVVIQQLLKEFPPSIVHTPVDGELRYRDPPMNPIPYKNVDEFFAMNPNCCAITTMRNSDEGSPGDMQLLTGTVSGFARIEYALRYKDSDGVVRSVVDRIHVPISNCAKQTHFDFPAKSLFARTFGFYLSDIDILQKEQMLHDNGK